MPLKGEYPSLVFCQGSAPVWSVAGIVIFILAVAWQLSVACVGSGGFGSDAPRLCSLLAKLRVLLESEVNLEASGGWVPTGFWVSVLEGPRAASIATPFLIAKHRE